MYQKRVVKKVAKKKAAGARGKVAAKPAIEKDYFGSKPKPKQGAMSGYRPAASETPGLGIGALFLFLFAVGLLGVVAVCFMPPDLSGISGYPVGDKPAAPGNLLRKLDDAISAGYIDKKESTLSFSEEDINAYINQRLKKLQTGPFAASLQMHGLFCDLQPDTANIYVIRSIFGKPLVIYTSWAFEGDPEDQKFTCLESGIGAIKMKGPSLQPVTAPFFRLRDTCLRERGALQDRIIDRLRIEDGKLVVHVQP